MKILYTALLFFIFSAPVVLATCTTNADCSTGRTCNAASGQCVTSETSDSSSGGVVSLTNPLTGASTNLEPQVLIGKVINAALGVVGSLALVMFIYGGFTWMLAAGNAEAVKKGKDIIIWATIGLVIIFSAYALVKLVFSGMGVVTT